jgi:hypothetical protein
VTPRGLNADGISGSIGTIFLIVVVAAGMMLLMVAVISQPHPQTVPAMTADVVTNGNVLYIRHTGGDTLQKGEFRILVDGQDKTAALGATTSWSVGQTLQYSYDSSTIPGNIQIVYSKGGYNQTIEQLWITPPH